MIQTAHIQKHQHSPKTMRAVWIRPVGLNRPNSDLVGYGVSSEVQGLGVDPVFALAVAWMVLAPSDWPFFFPFASMKAWHKVQKRSNRNIGRAGLRPVLEEVGPDRVCCGSEKVVMGMV